MKADVDREALEGSEQKGGVLSPGADGPDDAASLSGTSIVRSRLFVKYVALLIAVVVLALVANGAFEVWFSYREHKSALIDTQRLHAQAAADKIEEFVTQIDSQVGWTTQLPWTDGTLDQRRFDALRLLRQVPAITELAQIDATGHEQLKVSRLTMDVIGSGIDYSNKPEFKEAVANKVYYGPVYFRRESEPYMTIALAGARRDSGVSIAQVNLKLIWDVVSKIKVGINGRAYVVDGDGRLIAHPDISLVLRNTDMSHLAQVESARNGSAGEAVQDALDIAGHRVLTAFAPVVPLGWFVFVETPIEEAYAPLYASIQRTGYVLFGALALAFIAGLFLAGRMVVPIQALRAGAARLGSGDLSQRIRIKTGDEVEALASQFNDMAAKLQESYADLEKKVEQRTHELSEALEQQTATSEVLKIISRSTFDLQTVLDTLVESAARLCEADVAVMNRLEGADYHVASSHGLSDDQRAAIANIPISAGRGTITGRAAQERRVVHVSDIAVDPEFTMKEWYQKVGSRTMLGVPLLREGTPVGVIVLMRRAVRPFSEKQIELAQTFADQAVIAIENVRLFKAEQERTAELSEALEQQTATSEVLRVISSSPGDLEPVFSAMLENATRICDAKFGVLFLAEGDAYRSVSLYGATPEFAEARRRTPLTKINPATTIGRVALTKQAVQVADIQADPGFTSDPERLARLALSGARTMLNVPMLKEAEVIGQFAIYRDEVRPFSEKQIDLVRNFAAQAVIAIENTRLLNELRESLDQQTATAEVLGVISSSPGDLDPVFAALLERATRICDANFGNMFLCEGGAFQVVAMHNAPEAYARVRSGEPLHPSPKTALGRLAASRSIVQIADMTTEAAYIDRDPTMVSGVELAGIRTLLAVPMLKEDRLIGAVVIYRHHVSPFTDKQIELLKSFAAQAVIAIENTRLLNELRESLEQQTAISEILRVISNSPDDVQPVLNSVAEHAARICEAPYVDIILVEDGVGRARANFGGLAAMPASEGIPLDRSSAAGRSICDMQPVQVEDQQNVGDDFARGREYARRFGHRTILGVPLVREGRAVGTIMVRRTEVRPFEPKDIALLTTFADQAAIAIENVRLFKAEQERTRELSESLKQQTATADVLKIISRSTFDLQTVLDTLVESAAQLCEAEKASINRAEDGGYRAISMYGFSPEFRQFAAEHLIPAGQGSVVGRTVASGATVQIPDVTIDPDYRNMAFTKFGNVRTLLGVPMLREGTPTGVIAMMRSQVRPFTEKQIELAQTFADQAVIAIENVRLFEEIQEKSRQVEEASRHKSQFLANMSHELRTPLNAILGYTELILDGIYGDAPAKMRNTLERVQTNGKHLLGLINDVLDLSKIEAGQLVLTLNDYSIKEMMQGVYVAVEPLAGNKKLGFKLELPPDLPVAHGDERRLSQVLLNLVGNAIKFTDTGAVTMRAAASNGSYTIAVNDTGPGIAEADQAKIFEEFKQSDSTQTKAKGGTGLGLSIAKRIVEMHGGKLWVESALGNGSTFFVMLPLKVESQVAAKG